MNFARKLKYEKVYDLLKITILNLKNQISKLKKDLSKTFKLSYEVTQIIKCNHDLSSCD